MLEKSMYDSWASRIHLFIKGKKQGRIMLDSIDNGPLVYQTVEEDGQTRPKKYSKLTEAQQLQDECDVQATNIILYGLPPDVYALVNHQEAAKDIWGRVKLLMKGTELSYQEHECRLYSLFNKFAYQVQINTMFLNALPPEWSKFVTNVKLAKSLYTTNYDQLYAYLSQHERHANEQGEDPIDYINKAMACLSAVASRFPPSNNQLRMSSNLEIRQPFKMEESQFNKFKENLQEGHMARQCTQPKRPRNSAWFKEKLMLNMQEMLYSEQTHIDDFPDNKITSNNNISPYSQYLQESQDAGIQDTTSSAPNDLLVLSLVEQMTDYVANLDKENQKNKMRIKPTLYDGSFIAKEHAVISVIDDEETLILEEESRSKMLDKQNDPILIKQKINISPIDYSKLNKIKEDFGKCFVTQKELSAKQSFWLKHSNYNLDTSVKSHTPVKIEAPSELPKVSLVNESLKKLKYHLTSFEKVVKKRTTSDAITAGAWGLEHTKAYFVTEIIPFLKVLKDTFNVFDKSLLDEITEVQTVFNQMEDVVDQCFVDKNALEIQINQLSIDNDQLLNQIMSQEIMHIAMILLIFLM
ncbi:hypothetical protein Tco_0135284 [Tanacetum coccineum]